MKTKWTLLLGMLIVSLSFSACSNGVERDYVNYNAEFTVTSDAEGADLLANDEFLNNTYVEHRGEKYNVVKPGDENFWYDSDVIKSRYNMPSPWALRLFRTDKGRCVLGFGEFGPQEHYKNETFTIYWGDGSRNTVSFNLYVKHNKVKKESSLDGKKGEFFVFDLKK